MFLPKAISIVFAAVLIPFMIYAEEVPEPSDLASVDCSSEDQEVISQEDLQESQTDTMLSVYAVHSPEAESSIGETMPETSMEPSDGQTTKPAVQEPPLSEALETAERPSVSDDQPVAETADDSAVLESSESEENTDDVEIDVTSAEETFLSEQAAPQQDSALELPGTSDTSLEIEGGEPEIDLSETLSDTEMDDDTPAVTKEDPVSSQVDSHTEKDERSERQTTKDLSMLLSSVRLCGEGVKTSADHWRIPNGTVCELSLIFKENDSLCFASGLLEYRLPGNFIPFVDDINSCCGTATNQSGNVAVTVDPRGSVQVNWDSESAEPDILTVSIKGTWKPVTADFSFGNGISKQIEIVELVPKTIEDETDGTFLSTGPESLYLSSQNFTLEPADVPADPVPVGPDIHQNYSIPEEEEQKADEANSKNDQREITRDESPEKQTSVTSQLESVSQPPAKIMDDADPEMTLVEDQNGIEAERASNPEATNEIPQDLPDMTYEYQELTVVIPCSDNTTATLSLSGNLPVNAKLVITPVELSVPGQAVFAAFDLKIHDGYGNEYNPDAQTVQTSIFIPTSENGTRNSPERFHLYHFQDEVGGAQLISFDNEDNHTLCFSWPAQ